MTDMFPAEEPVFFRSPEEKRAAPLGLIRFASAFYNHAAPTALAPARES